MGKNEFEREYDVIKDLTYDKELRGFTNDSKDTILRTTAYKDGTGSKYDLYEDVKEGKLSESHKGTHVQAKSDGSWTKDSHNVDKSDWSHSSGSGCYLTSACLQHFKDNFDDDCEELTILRWFRDNYVLKEDIEHYYQTTPIIVEAIDKLDKSGTLYEYIYEHVVLACVEAIKNGDYQFAYDRYKNSILIFEERFARPLLESRLVGLLGQQI